MANYQEGNVAGRKWRRANRVEISNPPGTDGKLVTFFETEHTELDNGRSFNEQVGKIMEPFLDPTQTFGLRNPVDDSPLLDANGVQLTSNYQNVYVLLHSLYLFLAERRDAAQATPAP
jgi:hypothetical protein